MKNLLLLAGGALVAVGAYKLWQMSRKGNKTSCSSKSTNQKPVTVIEYTNITPPPDPMSEAVRVFNASPAATFAHPRTTVVVPGALATETLNINMADELVRQ